MMYDEEVDIASALFETEPGHVYCGTHFRYRSVVLDLKPVQRPENQVSPIVGSDVAKFD